MPLGPLASEGTKALLSRRNISTPAAFSSVVLENIFYSISVAIVVMIGTLAFLLGYRPTNAALTITLALGVVAIVVDRCGLVAAAKPAAPVEPVSQA